MNRELRLEAYKQSQVRVTSATGKTFMMMMMCLMTTRAMMMITTTTMMMIVKRRASQRTESSSPCRSRCWAMTTCRWWRCGAATSSASRRRRCTSRPTEPTGSTPPCTTAPSLRRLCRACASRRSPGQKASEASTGATLAPLSLSSPRSSIQRKVRLSAGCSTLSLVGWARGRGWASSWWRGIDKRRRTCRKRWRVHENCTRSEKAALYLLAEMLDCRRTALCVLRHSLRMCADINWLMVTPSISHENRYICFAYLKSSTRI
mmetsp:Transcript_5919/g.12974  ORF Transcript_5919/g.12974 Transcript_5919/m.12974 type:complete len:262 (+) Transcript_5919:760-1545(+)